MFFRCIADCSKMWQNITFVYLTNVIRPVTREDVLWARHEYATSVRRRDVTVVTHMRTAHTGRVILSHTHRLCLIPFPAVQVS
jgi:hypothetical protein